MRVSVHYTGTLLDGTVFDSTRERAPFTVPLGKGMLIRGFEDGVTGMRRGGLRRITIPPHLGYGERATGKIPPGSTLVFEVELLDIE
ncbi:MAG: FKBP-type peptidyl-prolyl cis-trans isomerase [Polyangiaceae bacterium]|nr:FKBP-type peptidyl-prolyl cis-trans isomerase [Polyangiaceae bacterium]